MHVRGGTIKALDRQFLDLSTTIGKGILAFLSASAQDERERILSAPRTASSMPRRAGSTAAVHRRSTPTRARLAEGESARSVARLLGVSHVTVAKLRVA